MAIYEGKKETRFPMRRERASERTGPCTHAADNWVIFGRGVGPCVCYGVILVFFLSLHSSIPGWKKKVSWLLSWSFSHSPPSSAPTASSTLLYKKLRKESRTAPPLLVGFFFSIPTYNTIPKAFFIPHFAFYILLLLSTNPLLLFSLSRCCVSSAGQATQQVFFLLLLLPLHFNFKIHTHTHSRQMTCFFLFLFFIQFVSIFYQEFVSLLQESLNWIITLEQLFFVTGLGLLGRIVKNER